MQSTSPPNVTPQPFFGQGQSKIEFVAELDGCTWYKAFFTLYIPLGFKDSKLMFFSMAPIVQLIEVPLSNQLHLISASAWDTAESASACSFRGDKPWTHPTSERSVM